MTANSINSQPGKRIDDATLRLERILPASPERVWSYLTDADKRARWFAGGSAMTGAGETATLHFFHKNITDEETPDRWKSMDDGGFKSEVEVLAFDPPKTLTYTWPETGHTSEVTFELTPHGDETRLVLTHRRIGSIANMVSFAGGWHAHVDALIQLLNGEEPHGFWANVVRLDGEYRKALGQE